MSDKGRNCILCEHFWFSLSDSGYSEWTPGSEASMQCCKNHWDLDFELHGREDLRKALLTANTCSDYLYWRDAENANE